MLAIGAPIPSARGQQSVVNYSDPEEIALGALPLSLSVAGWPEPGFTKAVRRRGTIEGQTEPVVTRYEAPFAHGGYFGQLRFIETTHQVRWTVPTPRDSIHEWGYFQGKPNAFGGGGTVTNGQMVIDYVLLQIEDAGPKSCALFSGAFERSQLRGFVCAVQDGPIADAAPQLIRSIGRPGLLSPITATLPVLRATSAPGGQEIVAGAPFDPRTMPFVSDTARAKLRAYVTAPQPKALAVNASGALAWFGGQSSENEAIRRALERCAFDALTPCMLYAVGDRVVFHHDALINQPVVNSAAVAPTAPLASGNQAVALSNAQLVAHLERATVFVVARRRGGGAELGTGFFVSPNRLLTNRHVVDNAETLLVTSRVLGRPYPARLIAMTNKGAIGAADYALLEVPGIAHEQLTVTTLVAKLQEVIAAGYPGITIGNDEDYRAFAQGNRDAAPDLVITRGEINAIQINQSKTPTFAHTALISEGNSGGPLVDRCGRVVGINSYIAAKTTVTGFAIASPDLIEFLAHNGLRPNVSTAPCGGAEAAR
ncbi:MAG: serine protease [Pseudomonadota bacterium]